MIGPFLMMLGLVLIWAAVRGKSAGVLKVLTLDQLPGKLMGFLTASGTPTSSSGGSSGGSKTTSSGGGNSSDSGSHMGLDADGNIITINKAYADMSAAEKDAANSFAHKFPAGLG